MSEPSLATSHPETLFEHTESSFLQNPISNSLS